MDSRTYFSIITAIREYSGLTMNCLKMIKTKFPNINHRTLCSIVSLDYQKQMKHNYIKSDAMINKYYNGFMEASGNNEPPGIIVRMSEKTSIAPCLIAKLILSKYLENENYESDIALSKNLVNKFLRDTSLIKNKELAYEIYLCTLYDDQYSPIVETMKSSLGQQYEIQLYRQISNLGIAYRDEEYLRRLGYDKTPDVKLEIPIAIDGFIIHWIESKARFGDYDVHKDYIRNQYSSYWNRFGTGLVIYWFGYLDTVDSSSEKRFIVRDHLPENIVTIGTT